MAEEYKVDGIYLCGLPIEEVQRVLMIYKETGHSEAGYQEGFRDGVNAAFEEFQKTMKSVVEVARW